MTADFKGRRILVVEDEMMIAMLVEDIWPTSAVTWSALPELETALKMATDDDHLDAAVLDVNLGASRCSPWPTRSGPRACDDLLHRLWRSGTARRGCRRAGSAKPFREGSGQGAEHRPRGLKSLKRPLLGPGRSRTERARAPSILQPKP